MTAVRQGWVASSSGLPGPARPPALRASTGRSMVLTWHLILELAEVAA
ncbi:hypothetical protein ACIQKA_33625 [Streptomyces sp. NPDC092045]